MRVASLLVVSAAINVAWIMPFDKFRLAYNLVRADAPVATAVREAALYGPWKTSPYIQCFSFNDKERVAAINTLFPLYRAGWKWPSPCIPEPGRAIVSVHWPGLAHDVCFVSCAEAERLMHENHGGYVTAYAQQNEKTATMSWHNYDHEVNCITISRP